MGILDPEIDQEKFDYINKKLSRRGLKADLEECWEIHGPHAPDMNYQVYVGFAIPKDEKCSLCEAQYLECDHINSFLVAIYPGAIYEIESSEKWDRNPEKAIPVKRKKGEKGG